jgi:hypothetical protein
MDGMPTTIGSPRGTLYKNSLRNQEWIISFSKINLLQLLSFYWLTLPHEDVLFKIYRSNDKAIIGKEHLDLVEIVHRCVNLIDFHICASCKLLYFKSFVDIFNNYQSKILNFWR